MSAPVIACTRLTRWYGPVMGLADVTCELPPGITGLLGPNGAGKTTLLRLVTGQIHPSHGTITVLGEAPFGNPRVLSRLGFCPDEDALYEGLSAREMVARLAQLQGFAGREAWRRADVALARVGLTSRAADRVRTFSKGMRQRVKIAQAFVHDPDLLVLDEPLTGTDPLVRQDLQQAIREFAARGGSVLVSSHVLHEVEALTSRVLVLYGNRMLAYGEVQELRALMEDIPHRIRIRCDRPRDLARAIFAATDIRALDVGPDALEARTHDPAGFYRALPGVIAGSTVRVDEIAAEDVDLASVFAYLTR